MEDEIVMLKRRLQTELSVSGATAGTLVELTKQLEIQCSAIVDQPVGGKGDRAGREVRSADG